MASRERGERTKNPAEVASALSRARAFVVENKWKFLIGGALIVALIAAVLLAQPHAAVALHAFAGKALVTTHVTLPGDPGMAGIFYEWPGALVTHTTTVPAFAAPSTMVGSSAQYMSPWIAGMYANAYRLAFAGTMSLVWGL